MDKKLFVHLQGGRKVSGVLRGYDLFLNLVIDDALEETTPAEKYPIGTVVCNETSGNCDGRALNFLPTRLFAGTASRQWKLWSLQGRSTRRPSLEYVELAIVIIHRTEYLIVSRRDS